MCTLISKKDKWHTLSKRKDFRGILLKKRNFGGGKKGAITLTTVNYI